MIINNRTITYKNWTLFAKTEANGIVIDYTDPEGNFYSEPFCFQTMDKAINYGHICIDRLIKLECKLLLQVAHK
jgi:hypothetical protein